MTWKLNCGSYTLFVIEDGYYWRDPKTYTQTPPIMIGDSTPGTTRAMPGSTSVAISSPTATGR